MLRSGTERPPDGTVLRKRALERGEQRPLMLKSGFECGGMLSSGNEQRPMLKFGSERLAAEPYSLARSDDLRVCAARAPMAPARGPQAPARALKSGFACRPVLRSGNEHEPRLSSGFESRPGAEWARNPRFVVAGGMVWRSNPDLSRGVALRCGTEWSRYSEAHLSGEKDGREGRGVERVSRERMCINGASFFSVFLLWRKGVLCFLASLGREDSVQCA